MCHIVVNLTRFVWAIAIITEVHKYHLVLHIAWTEISQLIWMCV